jgi:cytochrome c-type biogenesis protein CcmH/NrfG
MLAKEKRFAIRSIAVGIVATGLVAGFCTWQAQQADARLYALQNAPTAKATPKILRNPDFVPDKPAGHWENDKGETVDPFNPDIDKAETEANQARDSRWFFSFATFAAFSLPLVWYFLLDRLREVSAALSGRDKSN